jgi:Zn-finger nucleic acid-binding protein
MQCPACTTERLAMTERQGIEIDYCPKCRGVWLDRGELDKLIDRGSATEQTTAAPVPIMAAAPSAPPPERHSEARRYEDERRHDDRRRYDDDDDDHRRHAGDRRHPHKRKSFLGDLFDFD